MIKLKAAALRTTPVGQAHKNALKKNDLYIIVDNVLDTYNAGSIFRLADAVAAKKVILCGATETPPNTRIKKASINTTEWVTWSYAPTAVAALQELKTQNARLQSLEAIANGGQAKLKIIAIEQDPRSVPYDKFDYTFPLALVVGHETHGVSPEVLKLCDAIVELPMWGVNVSLNVVVSLAIVLYRAMTYGNNA